MYVKKTCEFGNADLVCMYLLRKLCYFTHKRCYVNVAISVIMGKRNVLVFWAMCHNEMGYLIVLGKHTHRRTHRRTHTYIVCVGNRLCVCFFKISQHVDGGSGVMLKPNEILRISHAHQMRMLFFQWQKLIVSFYRVLLYNLIRFIVPFKIKELPSSSFVFACEWVKNPFCWKPVLKTRRLFHKIDERTISVYINFTNIYQWPYTHDQRETMLQCSVVSHWLSSYP